MKDNLKHNDIYSENINVQTKIKKILESKFTKRKKLIESMQNN